LSEETAKDVIIDKCEQLIKKIQDIVSAKIITTEDGKISEIHVISDSERDPKQIARDIESALITSLGSRIDHKKISVAQIAGNTNSLSELRLEIDGIGTKRSKNKFEVTVSFKDVNKNLYEGKASGIVSTHGRLRIVARATLDAISKCLNSDIIISLGEVLVFNICDHKAVSVMIYKISDEIEEPFLGSALVRQDVFEAVVTAILDALSKNTKIISNCLF